MQPCTRKRLPNQICYWAFVANPIKYRIYDALAELRVAAWRTLRSHVAAGDRVLIWKAKGRDQNRGVVALGEAISDSAPMPSGAAAAYYVDSSSGQTVENRARVHFVHPPNLPLWLDDSTEEVLHDLTVSRAKQQTVCHVTPEQWARVVAAAGGWPSAGSDATEARNASNERVWDEVLGQGFLQYPEVRRAVEQHAMKRAKVHLEDRGWRVEDVSRTQPYDLHCTRSNRKELRVEVKGTTASGNEVLLTANEVEHARTHHPQTALLVVSDIEVTDEGGMAPVAHSGVLRLWMPWEIRQERLRPLVYRYAPPY